MFVKKTTLIIPTYNRIFNLRRLLNQLSKLNLFFYEILVVDSSDFIKRKEILNICNRFNAKLIFSIKSSSSLQRNIGLENRNKNTKFVMFLDDDVIFYKDTFFEMNKIIDKYQNDSAIVGFGFNQISNNNFNLLEKIKTSKFMRIINLYSDKPGQVTKGGWHSKILNVQNDILADWVFTTASIFKSQNIKNKYFDETFGNYSYLEDLDYSYNLTKSKKKILISSKAKFKHPKNIDRSSFLFGKIEIINRYRIIYKHNLSYTYFLINVLLRFFISFSKILVGDNKSFARSIGNIFGMILVFKGKLK